MGSLNVSGARKLKKIRNRTYNSLTKKQKEIFENAVPKTYRKDRGSGQIVATPDYSDSQPYSEEYVEQFKLMDELFNITDAAKKRVSPSTNSHMYNYIDKCVKLRYSDFTVAPILCMNNDTIMGFAKKEYSTLSSSNILESSLNGFSHPFKDLLIKEQKSWLMKNVKNAHFHNIFNIYIGRVNNTDSYSENLGWTEEPFFQIIALNEFLQHSEDDNMSLGEYTKKNFDKLYDILNSHNYTSYSYTKNLLDKLTHSYETSLLICTSKTPKKDRELIESLTKEQVYTLYESLDKLTSKTTLVFHKIKDTLEPEDLYDVPSESDLSKMIARILAEKIINAEYSHVRDMHTLISSCHSTVKSTLSTLAYNKDKVSKNSVYYLRVYNLIKAIEDNKDSLTSKQAVGFILSLNANFKRMAADEGSIGDYINFLEEVLNSKSSENAAQFFGLLGEVLLKEEQVPTISQWREYTVVEEDFTIPISMVLNIITDDSNSIQKNPPKELTIIRRSLPI